MLHLLFVFAIAFSANSQNNLNLKKFSYNGLHCEILDSAKKTVKANVSFEYNPKKLTIPSTVFFKNEAYTITELGRIGPYVETLEIPATIIKIDDCHMPICEVTGDGTEPALKTILVSKDNPNYSSSNGVLFNKDKTLLIYYPTGKEDDIYQIPNSVKKIGKSAFIWTFSSVKIPNSVTEIADSAFERIRMKAIHIPSSVKNIGKDAFFGQGHWAFEFKDYFKKITVSPSNPYFSSKNGILYNKQQDSIICIPSGQTQTNEIDINKVIVDGVTYNRDLTILEGYDKDKQEESFIIPSTVKYILPYAFYKCDNLKKLYIPASVENISLYDKFEYEVDPNNPYYKSLNGDLYSKDGSILISCSSQRNSFTTPTNVKSICCDAFGDNIKQIYISSSVESMPTSIINTANVTISPDNKCYSIENNVLYNKDKTVLLAYSKNNVSTHFSIPPSVKVIGEWAFNNWDQSLTSVLIPNSVTTICDNAFSEMNSLNIPNSIKEIGINAFYLNFTSLEIPSSILHIDESIFNSNEVYEINVHPDNPVYCSVDGVLFNKDKTRLICFPKKSYMTEYTIPNGVKEISVVAFDNYFENLKTIKIPSGVKFDPKSINNDIKVIRIGQPKSKKKSTTKRRR